MTTAFYNKGDASFGELLVPTCKIKTVTFFLTISLNSSEGHLL